MESRDIHERYKDLGDYDTLLNESNVSFEELVPGLVYKRRLVTGNGSLVPDNSTVIYNCALWQQGSSKPFDSSWQRPNPILTNLSEDFVIPGIHELLLSMKTGEWCEALIRPSAAFGMLGCPPRIQSNATIFCVLEVIKILPNDRMSILARNPAHSQALGVLFEEFYAVSDKARKQGNYHLQKGQFLKALQRYKQGVRILETLTYHNEEEELKARDLLKRLFLNSAKSANGANIPRLALALCKRALLIDYNDVKVHWQRILAWKGKGEHEKALSCATRAMLMFPKKSRFFEKEVRLLRELIETNRRECEDLNRLLNRTILQ